MMRIDIFHEARGRKQARKREREAGEIDTHPPKKKIFKGAAFFINYSHAYREEQKKGGFCERETLKMHRTKEERSKKRSAPPLG